VKRGDLLRHLRKYGCHLKREGRGHSLWINPSTGAVEAVPRHTEISDVLARKICRGLLRTRDRPVSLANSRLERAGSTPAAQPERSAHHGGQRAAVPSGMEGADDQDS